jgi:hypothetical protein
MQNTVRNLLLAAGLAAGVGAASAASAQPALQLAVNDGPAAVLDTGVYVQGQAPELIKAQYGYGWHGRNYCWYPNGWHGAGYYYCGYAWRRGFGWGGPIGWNGWGWREEGYNRWHDHGGGGWRDHGGGRDHGWRH